MAEIVYCKNEKKNTLIANVCIGKVTQGAISLIWFSHLFFFFFFCLNYQSLTSPHVALFFLESQMEVLLRLWTVSPVWPLLWSNSTWGIFMRRVENTKFWIATPLPLPREWKTLRLFIPQASHFYWKNPSSKGRPCFPPNRIVTVHTCTICEWTLCLRWRCCPAVCW